MDILKQDRPLRLKILSLLLDPKWITIYGKDVINPNFFETEDEIAFAEAVHTFHETYNRPPTDPDDVIELMSVIDGGDLVYEIFDECESWDVALATDIVVQFAREQAVKLAILDSIDDVNKGNLSSPLDKMEVALKVGENIMLPGMDFIADIDQWLHEYWVDKIRTPWTHANKVLGGGLGIAELGILLAPTNVGKTMALVDIGYAAAALGSGKNVAHFTHEQEPETVSRRYAARMTFSFLKRGDDTAAYKELVLETARKLMPGKIRIIGGARKMKLSEMRSHLDRLNAEGFKFDLIIDDYMDEIEPERYLNEHRHELSAIARGLRNIAGEYQVPVWTATQSTRSSFNKEIITLEDVAEDVGKVRIADLVIAICQTKEEYDMEKCRLFFAKVRDGKKNYLFSAKFYSDAQAIITTGIVKKKQVDV